MSNTRSFKRIFIVIAVLLVSACSKPKSKETLATNNETSLQKTPSSLNTHKDQNTPKEPTTPKKLFSDRIPQLIEKLKSVTRQGADSFTLGNNTFIEGCRSYPHYSIIKHNQKAGYKKLQQDLITAIEVGLSCMLDTKNNFSYQHRLNGLKLLEILEDQSQKKTYSCIPGLDQNLPAYSTYEGFNRSSIEFKRVSNYIPNFPGVLLDTNYMAGNHDLFVERNIAPWNWDNLAEGFLDYAKNKVKNRGVKDSNRLSWNATPMLLFHEMLHWVGYKHGPNHLIDEVLLLQTACMGKNVYTTVPDKEASDAAKTILSDHTYWNLEKSEKKDHAAKNNYAALLYKIEHSTYTIPNQHQKLLSSESNYTKTLHGHTKLYGHDENIRAIQAILKKLESIPALNLNVIKPLLENDLVIYAVKPKDPLQHQLVKTSIFPSIAEELIKYEVFSGKENNKDFQNSLKQNRLNISSYFSKITGESHVIPFSFQVPTIPIGIYFDPHDDRMLEYTIDGTEYNLEEHLLIRLYGIVQNIINPTKPKSSETDIEELISNFRN